MRVLTTFDSCMKNDSFNQMYAYSIHDVHNAMKIVALKGIFRKKKFVQFYELSIKFISVAFVSLVTHHWQNRIVEFFFSHIFSPLIYIQLKIPTAAIENLF